MRGLLNSGPVLMLVTSLFWSTNSVVGRGVHDIVPPVGLAFWRWAVTLPIFALMAAPYLRRDWATLKTDWGWLAFLAALGIAGYNAIIYFALHYTTAINMVLINAQRPIIIVALSYGLYRTKVSRMQTLGLVLGFLGTLVVMSRGDVDVLLRFEFNSGDLWIFVGTVIWAVYTVFLPKRPAIHPTSFMFYLVGVGTFILLPLYLWESTTVKAVPLDWDAVGAILFLAIFSSVIGHMGYNRLVELRGANVAGVTSYLVMAFGVVLAILILGEAFHTYHAAGLALLVAGSYLASLKDKRALA
jgi:drug/metabolite transporter (DMT)-like permease